MADAKQNILNMTDFGMFYPRGHIVAAFPSGKTPSTSGAICVPAATTTLTA